MHSDYEFDQKKGRDADSGFPRENRFFPDRSLNRDSLGEVIDNLRRHIRWENLRPAKKNPLNYQQQRSKNNSVREDDLAYLKSVSGRENPEEAMAMEDRHTCLPTASQET